MSLDENLHPINNTLIANDFTIKDIIFVDDSVIDSDTGSSITFPFIYEFNVDGEGTTTRTLFGQSIIVIVEVTPTGEDIPQTYVSVHEYEL